MIKWIVGAALRFSRLVVAAAIGILGLGLFQLHNAPVDVYPEFEPPDIQIQAEALGLSAQEVEQLITVPIEQDLLNGIPWVRAHPIKIDARTIGHRSAIRARDRSVGRSTADPGADVAGQGAAQRRHPADR